MNEMISKEIRNLVIVPGHAIYEGNGNDNPYDTKNWVGTYGGYKYHDEVPNYVQHVQRGINLVDRDPAALLVFSGGKTRNKSTLTESESYLSLAEHLSWFGVSGSVSPRSRLEEFATDSFENLLFSIQLFMMHHSEKCCPEQVTVVGLRFKEERYRYHAKTIIANGYKDIDPFIFKYDGINDVPDYLLEAGSAVGEELTRAQFERWPFGDQGQLLNKRVKRDPHKWYGQRPYP